MTCSTERRSAVLPLDRWLLLLLDAVVEVLPPLDGLGIAVLETSLSSSSSSSSTVVEPESWPFTAVKSKEEKVLVSCSFSHSLFLSF